MALTDRIQISVRVDPDQLRAVERSVSGIANGTRRALSTGINKVLPAGRTQIARAVREELNVPYGKVLKTIKTSRSSPSTLAGSIDIRREPIKLVEFKPRETSAGVVVLVRFSKGPETLREAFVARMKSGHVGVFERQRIGGGGGNGGRVGRLPIHELYGPTVVGVVENKPGFRAQLEAYLALKLEDVIWSQVQWLLQKGQPPTE